MARQSRKHEMDLDFLLSEKDVLQKFSEKAKPNIMKYPSIDYSMNSDSENDDERNLRVKADAIEKIVDSVSEKLQSDHTDVEEWILGSDTIFCPKKLNPVDSWRASPDLLLLLESQVLGTYICGKKECDKSLAVSLFETMAYSESAHLESSSFRALSTIMKNTATVSISWLPSAGDFMDVFKRYGYREKTDPRDDSGGNDAIPFNIRSMIWFLTVYCESRSCHESFKQDDICLLISSLSRFTLEARLQPLMLPIQDCIRSLVDYCTSHEWQQNCSKIAKSIASVGLGNVENVAAILNLPVVGSRCLQLQQVAALYCLLSLFSVGGDVVDQTPVRMMSMFCEINRRKSMNYSRLYNQLKMADIGLNLRAVSRKDPSAVKKFVRWLHVVSTHIPASDITSMAPQARNWASFMHQKYKFLLSERE